MREEFSYFFRQKETSQKFVKINYFKRIFRPSLFYFIFDQENNLLFDAFSFLRIFFSMNFIFADFFFVTKKFLYHEFSFSQIFCSDTFSSFCQSLYKNGETKFVWATVCYEFGFIFAQNRKLVMDKHGSKKSICIFVRYGLLSYNWSCGRET